LTWDSRLLSATALENTLNSGNFLYRVSLFGLRPASA
jgi:hypothetical protein